jgi:hypothetical protein
MDVEHLYFVIGFLLGVLMTGCLVGIGIIFYYEFLYKEKNIHESEN